MPEDKNKQDNFKLSAQEKLSVDSLYKWSKFVSICTIVLGSITSLSIFLLAIPTAIIGIITIAMGVKLNIASNHLRYAIQVNSKESIFIAADHLRQYFTFNGIIIIISMIFFIIIAVIISLFAGAIIEIFNQSGFDYTISI
tara:strand:+ start:109 stop:531 length:423 start_codon:yes stop_codon:yes gene_type:complete